MSVLVGKSAPEFKAQAVMPEGNFKELSLSDYKGKKYVVLFFYPLDFTFVCPTEIIAFSERIDAFEKRNTQVLACSVDSAYTHLAWRNTPRKDCGLGDIRYPMIQDLTKKIARDYDVLMDDAIAFRGLFLIDKDGVVRHQVVNDLPLGRSVDEALRMVEALQFHEKNGEACPADWKDGEKGITPDPEGSKKFFSSTYS